MWGQHYINSQGRVLNTAPPRLQACNTKEAHVSIFQQASPSTAMCPGRGLVRFGRCFGSSWTEVCSRDGEKPALKSWGKLGRICLRVILAQASLKSSSAGVGISFMACVCLLDGTDVTTAEYSQWRAGFCGIEDAVGFFPRVAAAHRHEIAIAKFQAARSGWQPRHVGPRESMGKC